MLEPGDKAPPFTLADADRQAGLAPGFRRDATSSSTSIPQDDTPGCTKEACGFRDAWDDLQELGVAVLGVSADDADSHTKFAAKYRLPFTLLSDPDRRGHDRPTGPTARRRCTAKEGRGRDPLDRLDRSRRQGPAPLGPGRRTPPSIRTRCWRRSAKDC